MLKKAYTLGLLSIAALGMLSMPAKADTAVIQTNTQDLYLEGEGNTGMQYSEQVNIYRRHGGRDGRGSTGVVQDSYQGGYAIGDDNAVYQDSSQVNVTERGRGHGRGHYHRGHQRGRIHISQ